MDSLLCRICHESAEEVAATDHLILPGSQLIAPCCCSGTMKWVHRECINAWRYHSLMSSQTYDHGPYGPLWLAHDTVLTDTTRNTITDTEANSERIWWDLSDFKDQKYESRQTTARPKKSVALDFFQIFLGLGHTDHVDIDTLLRLQYLNKNPKNCPFLTCSVCQTDYSYVERQAKDYKPSELAQGRATSWPSKISHRLTRAMIGGSRRRIFCSLVAVYLLVASLGHFLSFLGNDATLEHSYAYDHHPFTGCYPCLLEWPSMSSAEPSMSWLYRVLLLTSLFIARLPALFGCLLVMGARCIAPAPACLALACRLVSVVELAFGPVTHAGRLAHYTLLSLFMIAWSIKSWTDQIYGNHELLPNAIRISAADPILFSLTIHAMSILVLDSSLSLKILYQKMRIGQEQHSHQHARFDPHEQSLYYWNIQSTR